MNNLSIGQQKELMRALPELTTHDLLNIAFAALELAVDRDDERSDGDEVVWNCAMCFVNCMTIVNDYERRDDA